jgi:glycine/D-amino acid oxidase-like deaminating enzyme
VLTFVVESKRHTGSEISDRLGLQPTDVVERGDPISRHNRARRTHTLWGLDSDLPKDAEPSTHLSALLPLVEARLPALRRLRDEGAATFWSCLVTAKPAGNQFCLEPETLSRLAAVGAPLDFDLYDSD